MNVYICSAARTAIGTYGGTLRDVHSSELGTAAAKAAIERAGVDKEAIDEVLFGQVLQGGVGQNVARQVCLKSGLPITTPAMTLNKVCASSMRAISLGTQIIRSGENKMMLVGGCESMSGAPYISRDTRWGARMGDKKLVDMMDTGVTVLFVSHNLDQVKRICNKAMILEHGEMKAFGDIDEIAPVYEEMIE